MKNNNKTKEIALLESILALNITQTSPLLGGSLGKASLIETDTGQKLVVKTYPNNHQIVENEHKMLNFLCSIEDFPTPKPLLCKKGYLIMEYIEGTSQFSLKSQIDIAHKLAALHSKTKSQAGFPFNTVIGPLPQLNSWNLAWFDFYLEQRLLPIVEIAIKKERFSPNIKDTICKVTLKFKTLTEPPKQMSLLHGDIWSGNVLATDQNVTAFLDPALYYGEPKMELAFIRWLSTFDKTFFSEYTNLTNITLSDEEYRIYSLYPILVHATLFGGRYVEELNMSLERLL